MLDMMRRYFVGNSAPILSIRRQKACGKPHFIPMRCGNSRGFWWRGWFVQWRTPYSAVWRWDSNRRAWEINQ